MKCLKRGALACLLTTMLIPLLLTAPAAMATTKGHHTTGDVPVPRARNLPGSGNNNDSFSGVAAISTKNVWAVGTYQNSNQIEQTLIEQWNGTSWSVVFSPNAAHSDEDILNGVAAVSANDVWAVGTYVNSNQIDQTLIELWNGTKWSVMPAPDVGSNSNWLYGVTAVSASDVWAVGQYADSNEDYQTLIEQWNGQEWSVVPGPNVGSNSNLLYGVTAVSTSDVWAVGTYVDSNVVYQTLIEQWNGQAWSVVPSPNVGLSYNTLSGVTAVSASDVWAVGYYYTKNDISNQALIEQWNGSNWQAIASPGVGVDNFLSGVTAVSASDVWAVGSDINKKDIEQALIEQWNGSKWQVIASPGVGVGGFLDGVAAVSASDIWAVGFYEYNKNLFIMTLIEQWDGTKWSIVKSPDK